MIGRLARGFEAVDSLHAVRVRRPLHSGVNGTTRRSRLPMSPPPHPSLLPALRCAAGNVWRRAQAPTPGALAAALFVALIAFQLSVHLDERGWNAKASPKDVATVDGHFAEWEWFHPMEAVHALDHPQTLPSSVSSQNVYRFLTAYGMALFYGPTGSLFLAGLLTTLLGWAAAGWAMYAL